MAAFAEFREGFQAIRAGGNISSPPDMIPNNILTKDGQTPVETTNYHKRVPLGTKQMPQKSAAQPKEDGGNDQVQQPQPYAALLKDSSTQTPMR
jgi:hypothetical protein